MSGHRIASVCGIIICLSFVFIAGCQENTEKPKIQVIRPTLVEIQTLFDIIPITDSVVQPVLYSNVGGFDTLGVQENKAKFIAAILPAVLIAKFRIKEDLQTIQNLVQTDFWTSEDSLFFHSQMERFDARDTVDLIIRMHTHPTSIVLAQAAVESGWGKSRFFSEANNVFGIWSYNPNRPRVAARSSRGNVHVRKYEDISGSVMDYFETIARARAYRHFRDLRYESDSINSLLPLLKSYSANRMNYVNQLKTVIAQNNFEQYDHYQLKLEDPLPQ